MSTQFTSVVFCHETMRSQFEIRNTKGGMVSNTADCTIFLFTINENIQTFFILLEVPYQLEVNDLCVLGSGSTAYEANSDFNLDRISGKTPINQW